MDKNIKTILDFLENKYGEKIRKHPSNEKQIFKLLIGTILSHRTKDETTWPANERLFKVAKTPKEMLKLSSRKIEKVIYPVGFYRQKAKKILKVSKILLEKYNDKVPDSREELMELPGVGPKTSDIVLMYGFGEPQIAVDTHCERLPKRLGLVPLDYNVKQIKEKLESLFPQNKWYLINLGFVNFGKEICKPVNPLCIKNSDNCPFSRFCKAYKTKRFKV